MIGGLARMLRLLGYDTHYSQTMEPAALAEIAEREDRIILTRGETRLRFPHAPKLFSVKSEDPAEQLREVVEAFSLDPRSGIWTRCTVCNGEIAPVAKESIESLVKPKVFELYDQFFRCAGCGQVYWQGSHVERILKNLSGILGREL